jgi:hypothetical protein
MSSEKEKNKKVDLPSEISKILSVISEKVSELNKCSNDDFIRLNESLKSQYKRIEEISKNVSNVFEYTSGEENQALFREVQNYFDDFINGIKCSERKFLRFLDLSEKIISYVNLMYIPLKNFLQNVVTLNFLVNSLKFNLVYRKKNETNVYDATLEKFAKIIQDLKNLNTTFDATTTEMKISYSVISENIRVLQENNLIIKEKAEDYIISVLKRLEEKYQEGKVRIPELKRTQIRYTDNVSHIITNLQYSDIIRQKIEHISEAHHDMIDKLKNIKSDAPTQIQTQYMLQIKDIADLQVAQLIRTNGEYQRAVQTISEKFVEISDDVFSLTNDTLLLSGRRNIDPYSHYDFYVIENSLGSLQQLVRNFVNENNEVFENLSNLNSQIKIYSNDFDKFKGISVETLNLVQEIQDITTSSYAAKDEIKDLFNQLDSVTLTLKNNYSDLTKYFVNIKNNIEEIVESGDKGKDCASFDIFSERINKIMEKSDENNKIIKEIVISSEKAEKIVSKEINSSVKEIQYYSMYEQVSVQIIEKLKFLFNLIAVEHTGDHSKAEMLEHQKVKYTMKSERDIHQQVALGEDIDNNKEEEEEEVEFF